MTYKLLMTWDILPGQEEEYFEFVVREFIPGLQHLGLEPTDAWFTTYGDNQPQIWAGAEMSNKKDIESILDSLEWQKLIDKLMDYVEGFSTKVVPSRKGFQM